jgi:anti-sigma factor RsiW
MSEPLFNKLRETGWRRKLTATEENELQAWLASHPEAQAEWESELALSETLERLPDAPVSSNFTARVLQAVEREKFAASREESRRTWSWHRLLPRAALAALVLCFGLVYYGQYQSTQRATLARNVAAVSAVAVTSDPVVLQDFEIIQHLGESTGPDKDLLALFQ